MKQLSLTLINNKAPLEVSLTPSGTFSFGSDKNIGILVQGTLPTAVHLKNVIIEYANVSDTVQTQINAGKNFYMFGSSTLSFANVLFTLANTSVT